MDVAIGGEGAQHCTNQREGEWISRLVDTVGRLVGWSVGRSVGWSVGWLVGWLVGWFVGWVICWFVGVLVFWLCARYVNCRMACL